MSQIHTVVGRDVFVLARSPLQKWGRGQEEEEERESEWRRERDCVCVRRGERELGLYRKKGKWRMDWVVQHANAFGLNSISEEKERKTEREREMVKREIERERERDRERERQREREADRQRYAKQKIWKWLKLARKGRKGTKMERTGWSKTQAQVG